MKQIQRSSLRCTFSASLFVYLALLLLFIPVRLLFAAITSAAVHELFHIAAMRIMKIDIYAIRVGINGAKIETAPMNDFQEFVCALAGPIGGLLLLFLFRVMPVVALTAAVQSLYNLLPLYPTDGGRALKSGMRMVFHESVVERAVYITEIITLSMIVAFCVFGSVWLRLGVIPGLFAVALLLKSSKRK